MKDEIIISGLKIFAWHGVYEEEKEKGQNFIVNAKLSLDTSLAGESDSLEDSVDYGKVCLFINDFMRINRFNLLEAVANQMARKIMVRFPMTQSVELEVMKPEAPIVNTMVETGIVNSDNIRAMNWKGQSTMLHIIT